MNIIELGFAWRPQGPLLSGYDYKFSREAEYTAPHEKKTKQYESRNPQGQLTPSLLATSTKGVFRSAAAWLVEREGQIVQGSGARRRYITADYADALPQRGPLQDAVRKVQRLDGLCPIGRVFGGGGGVAGESRNALRRQGLVRFSFQQADRSSDALFGHIRSRRDQNFAWEIASGKNQPLETETLVVGDAPRLVVQIGVPNQWAGAADQELAVALVCLAADLISTGFFRFGRFTSRGYGWVRLTEPSGSVLRLESMEKGWVSATERRPESGAALAADLLGRDAHDVVRDVVSRWLQENAL